MYCTLKYIRLTDMQLQLIPRYRYVDMLVNMYSTYNITFVFLMANHKCKCHLYELHL